MALLLKRTPLEISSEMLDFVPILGRKWHNEDGKSSRFHLEIAPILREPDAIASGNGTLSKEKWDNIQGKIETAPAKHP